MNVYLTFNFCGVQEYDEPYNPENGSIMQMIISNSL